jgi:UDP-glucose 4-epimerase
MSTYLVTGAAGFIGSAIAKSLIKIGHKVVSIDNLSTGLKSNIPDGVKFIEGDCADSTIYQSLKKYEFDAIFHIAGQSSGEISFDNPIYDVKTNTESTLLLLKYAVATQCKRFIYASTMSVYGAHPEILVKEESMCKPKSFYGVGKLASENYLRIYSDYGVNTTSLRLFNVYGPGQNLENLRQGMVSIFLAQLIKDKSIHVKGSGSRFRDFVYIDDVVGLFIDCLSNQNTIGQEINVGTGEKTSVSELIGKLLRISKINAPIQYYGATSGDIHGICANTLKLNRIFNKKHFISIDEGLKKMWIWAKNQTD